MKIHYFQRYHAKENVATANTMLLLSRLYQYSSHKFFRFLSSEFFADSFDPEIVFKLQEKSVDSIPDATITQESFKIVVETKMSDWFYDKQLMRHLNSFNDEKNKVLITLAPELMAEDKKGIFEQQLKRYNTTQNRPVIHINTTFEGIANAIQEVIDDRDFEMQEVLDDYLNYCNNDNLIAVSDSWKFMRMQLANNTFDFNVSQNLYYDNVERGFRSHDYLSLYKNKSVRAIGKVSARITAVKTEVGMQYEAEYGDVTEERKQKILRAISDGDEHGYDLRTIKHRYFFVEKFYETDFKKMTPRAPMGSRVFNLTDILGTEQLPITSDIAQLLKTKTWN
ncbi:hypothetical protein [Bacillus altitudinis]|uniref:hypothetical protein n=1 Tax=Bacillus TaxID=1386 RepID=UPI0030188130